MTYYLKTFHFYKTICILSTPNNGFTKKLSLISWNNREPVYDIRAWNDDHTKYGEGVTLTTNQLIELKKFLDTVSSFNDICNDNKKMRNKNYATKIGWCAFCNQGWLEIWKTVKTNNLTVVCSECDSQYDSPEEALNENTRNRNARLYSVEIDGITIDPTNEELAEVDWQRYIIV